MQKVGLSTTAAVALILGVTAAAAQSAGDARGAADSGAADNSQTSQSQTSQAPAPDRIALNKEQQTSIRNTIGQLDIRPETNLDLSLSRGTLVPDSVRLVPVPESMAAELPRLRNYSFFIDAQQELVIVDPGTRAIHALVPMAGGVVVGAKSPPDTERRKSGSRSGDTERAGANSADDSTGEVPKKKLSRSDRHRGTTSSGAERRRPAGTETDVTAGSDVTTGNDVTVGSSVRETDEVQAPPPVVRRVVPPVRDYRRVEPERGPSHGGPFGIFGLFNMFR